MRRQILIPFAALALLLAAGDSAEEARRQFRAEALRFNDINVRRMRGIKLTPEEEKVVESFNARRGALNKQYLSHQQPAASVGIMALNDFGIGTYKGE